MASLALKAIRLTSSTSVKKPSQLLPKAAEHIAFGQEHRVWGDAHLSGDLGRRSPLHHELLEDPCRRVGKVRPDQLEATTQQHCRVFLLGELLGNVGNRRLGKCPAIERR